MFTPGNLIVSVGGCGLQGGTCTTVPYSGPASSINGPAGGYSDDQASPWTLFQFSVTGATSATYVNSVQLPQITSGANLPVSNDYGSLSEGVVQLSGDGRFLTMLGFGINAATFNGNYLNYCPGSTSSADACVPSNDNPATAQTGTLVGQSYSGNIPVPRVAALIDPYGNVNSSTVLYNIYNQNDPRSAYSPNGSTMYVSGQGCKTWDPTDFLCDGNGTSPFDDTAGVYLTAVGTTNYAPTPITGPDNGPANCTSLTTCNSSIDTRMVTAFGNTLYVSLDAKPGSTTGGYNRSYVGSLGSVGATSVFTCAGVGAGCPTGDGPYGPALLPGVGNTGGTGKYTLNTAGAGNNSNGNNLNVGLAVNLSPQNFFFASPTVLYIADTGSPKNTSNGPDAVCTTDHGKSSATVGDGGLQKWMLNPAVKVTLASGSTTASASSGAFTQGEVGLPITGTGIPAGTTIKSVSSAGANATLSQAATISGSSTVTVSGWSLAYTLYNGLNLVLNSDCNPNTPTAPGTIASTGLYGVTGVVSGGVATLYVTSNPSNDLVQSYLYGITDTLTTATMTSPGTAFTQLATAPSDSVFRGVSMAPSLPNGSETITSTPSGLTFTSSGTGCAPGTYVTPFTLAWTAGKTCTLGVAAAQTVGNTPTNPATTTYNFSKWQDGSTATTDSVTAPATTGVYNISFQTVPTVTFPTASALTYGQTLASSTLSGGSAIIGINGIPVAGTFAFTAPSTVPNPGTAAQNVTFTPTDTTDYTAVTGTVSVTVSDATPTVSAWPTASSLSYGQTLASSTLSGGSASVAGTFAFSAPATLPPTGTTPESVTFTPTNTADYTSVTGTVTVTVTQAVPVVTFPTAGAISYGQSLSSSTLSGGSAVSGMTTVAGSFAFMTPGTTPPTGTSSQSVIFTPTDSTDYSPVTGTVSVTVNPIPATVSLSNTTQIYNGSPEVVTVATTPAGLGISVSYSGTPGTSYGPSTTAPTNPGTYSVVATVVDPNYVGQQSGTLTINQVDPTVSLALLAGQPTTTPYGTTVYFVVSTAGSPQCPTGTVQLYIDGAASGSPTSLSGSSCSQPVQFQTAALSAGAHSLYAAYSGDTYFEAENSSALSYTVSQDATTVTLAASGSSVNVGQSLSFTATVTPASPSAQGPAGTVTFFDGTTQIGTGSALTSAPYTSTFSTSSLAAGSHSISATFTDTDGNFAGSSSPVDVETVNLIVPAITWTPSPTEFAYGPALGSTQLNATAVDANNNPISGSFAYNFASGTILPAGTVNLTATFTPTDPTTYATNSASVTITVDQATPVVTFPTASAISYGQSLSSSTLSGGSAVSGMTTVAGSFAFTTPGTTPPTGTSSQNVIFTPTDSTDYSPVTGTVMVTVNLIPATVSLSNTTQTYSGSPEGVTVTTTPAGLGISVSYSGTPGTSYGPSTTAPTNPGTYSVVATVVDPNYVGQQSGTLTINQVDPTVSLALLAGQPTTTPYGTTVYFVVSTAGSPQCPTGTVQLYIDGVASGSPTSLSGSSCSQPVQFQTAALSAGAHSLYAAYSGDTYFESENSSPLSYTVSQDTTSVTLAASGSSVNVGQSLTFTATITPTSPSAQGPAGTVTFFDGTTQIGTGSALLTSAPYTSTFSTTSLAAGSHSISATFTDTDGNFIGGSSPVDVETVNLIVPAITWTPSPTEFAYGPALGSTQLNAAAVDANNNPISGSFAYNFASGTILPAGTANLTATFTPTDPTTYASNTASVTITVDKATPVVNWATPAAITYGTALSAMQLDATAAVAGAFVYSPALGAVPAGGSRTLSVAFTPRDTADYNTVEASVPLQVNAATPTIVWAAPAAIPYGTALSGTQLDAKAMYNGATVNGTLTYTPAIGTVLGAGAQTLNVVFTPSNTTSNFISASGMVTLQVTPTPSKVTWATPAAIPYGTPLSTTQLDATSSVSGAYVYSPVAGTVLTAGKNSLSVTFYPANSAEYAKQTVNTTITVTKATPAITWPTPGSIVYGTALSTTQLDATASVPGNFTYSPASGVLAAGVHTLAVTFTPKDTTDYNVGHASVTLQVAAAMPTIVWATPAAITYGTALSGTQLDAKATFNGATLSGTLTYTPGAGTVLSAGPQNLSVSFTSSNTTNNFTSAAGKVTLQVNQATPKITWAAPAAITSGTPLSATQLDATASVPGVLVYTPALGTVLPAGKNNLSVTFTPKDSADYVAQTINTTITVKP